MTKHRFAIPAALAVVIGGALALTFGPTPAARAQAPIVLKIQASWPASLTLFEHLKLVAERVDKLSNGTPKIEPLPAGTIVPAFEVLDATSKKVIDGAHTVAYYWVGKNKTAVLFTGGPGGNYGMDFIDVLGWMYEGGGLELYQQFYKDVLKLNVVPLPAFTSGPQALGWFKRPIKNLDDFKGMKCRQTGINAKVYTEMGMRTVNLPGGEILPAAERGVIDCAEWVGGVEDLRLGFHNVWKYHYTPGMHEPRAVCCASAPCPGSAANRTSSGQTLTPFVGIAGGVKDAVDGYCAFDMLVEDRIRKAAHQPPPIVLVDRGMHLRRAANRFNARIDAAQKLLAQADPLPLVPGVRFCEIVLGLRRDDELSGHNDCGPVV